MPRNAYARRFKKIYLLANAADVMTGKRRLPAVRLKKMS
jgi:hypothetical protein